MRREPGKDASPQCSGTKCRDVSLSVRGRCGVVGSRCRSLPAKNVNDASYSLHSGPWTFWKKPTSCRRPGQLEWGRWSVISCDYLICLGAEGGYNRTWKCASQLWRVERCIALYIKKMCFGQSVKVGGHVCMCTHVCVKSQGHTPAVTINSPFGLFSGFLFQGLRLPSTGRDLGPWSWLNPIALFCSVMPQIGHAGCREHWALSK